MAPKKENQLRPQICTTVPDEVDIPDDLLDVLLRLNDNPPEGFTPNMAAILPDEVHVLPVIYYRLEGARDPQNLWGTV